MRSFAGCGHRLLLRTGLLRGTACAANGVSQDTQNYMGFAPFSLVFIGSIKGVIHWSANIIASFKSIGKHFLAKLWFIV